MVHFPKLTFVANDNNLTGVGFALGKTIFFESLEFTADHFGNLRLSPEGNDSSAIFIGMVHHLTYFCSKIKPKNIKFSNNLFKL
jgi:hypothetical protein